MKLIIEYISALLKMLFILSSAPFMLAGFLIGYFYYATEVGFFYGKLYLSQISVMEDVKNETKL